MSTVTSPIDAEPVGPQGAQVDITQRPALSVTGWLGVLVLAGTIWWIVVGNQHNSGWLWVPAVVFVLVITSLVIVTPGQTSVVQFFGSYIGTVQRPGFWWVLPLTLRRGVSIRVRNFETGHLKVNDADGSPVEIAAIVVWQIADTAKSTYAVQNYLDFVTVQAESALRHVATTHPYDNSTDAGNVAARFHRCRRCPAGPGGRHAGLHCRGRDRGGPDLPSRLRPRDRARDAAPPAGQRRHGQQPDGGVVRRSAAVAGREHWFALHMSERRQVLLRLDPAVHDALIRWANDEFRSVNAQVEMLLRRALTDAGRMPTHAAPIPKRGRPRTSR
jgi:hypothetical protein